MVAYNREQWGGVPDWKVRIFFNCSLALKHACVECRSEKGEGTGRGA